MRVARQGASMRLSATQFARMVGMNKPKLALGKIWRSTAVLTLIWLSAAGGTAMAADADAGRSLARTWCSSCHVVDPGGGGSDAARAFEAIAKDPNFTEDGIRAWLADPHPPMPNLNLSRSEVDAIVAYLEQLSRR
jgi:mono/diheme cytochrome c family protein